jgi:hypothetical protein
VPNSPLRFSPSGGSFRCVSSPRPPRPNASGGAGCRSAASSRPHTGRYAHPGRPPPCRRHGFRNRFVFTAQRELRGARRIRPIPANGRVERPTAKHAEHADESRIRTFRARSPCGWHECPAVVGASSPTAERVTVHSVGRECGHRREIPTSRQRADERLR